MNNDKNETAEKQMTELLAKLKPSESAQLLSNTISSMCFIQPDPDAALKFFISDTALSLDKLKKKFGKHNG